MNNPVFISFMDGEEQTYYTEDNIITTKDGCISFIGTPETPDCIEDEERKITINLQNIAFHRHFKENPLTIILSNDFVVHYKTGRVIPMMKGDISISGDYLVCDTENDATFIPLKNIKYHEVF